MHETWSDPDATHPLDGQSFLQALSLQEKVNTPLLALAGDRDGEARLVFASRALFGLFEAATPQDLSHRLLLGADPGAKRLATLFQTLSPESAPRLERLRFFLGPSNEVVTVLCRRILLRNQPVFIAAALNLRPGLIAAEPKTDVPAEPETERQTSLFAGPARLLDADGGSPSVENAPTGAPSVAPTVRDASALQADLRRRWPAARTLRFLWQTDADAVCTLITPPLADVVGAGTADLVGRNLLDLAPQLDPSGRLAAVLSKRDTWSGLELDWPLADAAATVTVVAGAIPASGADMVFEGFRGFGVIHLDRVKDAAPRPWPSAASEPRAANILSFPGHAKMLSRDDQAAFAEIGETLREQIPPVPASSASEPADRVSPTASEPARDVAEGPSQPSTREQDVARNALLILDKLALGVLVSRDNVPIFANRHLLDLLDFADEDALHAAGGITHLFGGFPGDAAGGEAVDVRGRTGAVVAAHARMQAIDWDGLPATLLTLRPAPAVTPATEGRSDPEARRQQDGELRELRAILETATDGVAVLDADGAVLSLNRSGEALFGCDRGMVIGKPFLSLFAPHNQGLAADYLQGLKSDATRSLLNDGREFLVKAHQGGTIPVFMTLGRLGPSGGSSDADPQDEARFCALFRDLTSWKKAEYDLDMARRDAEHASARKSEFLAKVSHEIRTPLTAIIGFAEVIMDERFGPIGNERYKDYLRDIRGSGTHVMSLVNDLLDLSKIEAGKMELDAVAVDANGIIAECVSVMQPQASRERIIMRLSLAAQLPRIRADIRSLRQIVLNLLSNAVKFNDPGGQVIVATALTEAGHVVIRIRDTGPGMSDTDIVTALEPFRQLSSARPSKGGTGLGLPLTKALVEANHASLTIRSKVDQGTLVEVAFPPAQVLAD